MKSINRADLKVTQAVRLIVKSFITKIKNALKQFQLLTSSNEFLNLLKYVLF